jgi:hypothetical protein
LDVFVGGVLCTRVALAMGMVSLWSGLEPGRKFALPLGLLFWYTVTMPKSIKVHQKKSGRPATGRDPAVTIRLPQEVLDGVATWATKQPDELNRSQAIRRLVELGLKAKAR